VCVCVCVWTGNHLNRKTFAAYQSIIISGGTEKNYENNSEVRPDSDSDRHQMTSQLPQHHVVLSYRAFKESGRGTLQRTVSINKITMLQQTCRNTIGRRSTRVPMTCRAFPLWLERQSSSLLSSVKFSCQLIQSSAYLRL